MGNQREQLGRQLLQWIMAHPDRPLTVEAMAKAVGWNDNSASSTAARFTRQYPDNFVRTSKGVYRWSSVPTSDDAQPVKELLLRVIKHRSDGAMLAENIDDGDQLFVVTPFEF
jgi:hypothetical protein